MKGIYKFGIVVLLLFTITSASAITEIGDNITVPNNVTAQNFLGNLNWAYLLGIPTDFPNSTVAGYNGNFPNTSVTNIQGVNTAQNTSISNLQSNDTVHDSKISTIQSNETGYAKIDGSRTVTGSWSWGGFNLTNALRVVASFFEGDGSRLSNLNASNLTGTFNASTDARTNFPNNTIASKEASWDGKTTLSEVNQSANLYNVNGSNITSGIIPTARYLGAVNSSAQISRSQVTGQTGVDDSQNTTKANKTNIGEFTGGTLGEARLPAGTVILLSGDQTLVTGTATNTAAITYSLGANSYSYIIAEAEVNVTGATNTQFEWKFDLKDGTTVVDSFNLAAKVNAVNKFAGVLKATFVENNAQTISVSVTGVTASGTWGVRSLRVYGVI